MTTTLLVAALGLLVAACSGGSGAAAPSSTTRATTTTTTAPTPVRGPAVPTNGVYFGLWRGPGPGRPTDPQLSMGVAETQLGRRAAVDHRYYDWGSPIPGDYDRATAAAGRIPMISLCACRFRDRSTVRWSSIADGSEDPWLTGVATRFAQWDTPAFVVFSSEPEDHLDTAGSPEEYRAAFRHVVEAFRAAGANKVAFVFATTGYAFQPGVDRQDEVAALYPGDDVVDWIGADPYNFFRNGQWDSFQTVVDPWYRWATSEHPAKPLMLTEWGSKEDPADPVRKAAWIADAGARLRRDYPDIRAVVYFDEEKHERGEVNDWRIDTSADALAALRQLAVTRYLNPSG